MKTKKLFQYTSIALIVILLFAAGPAQGQGPGPQPEGGTAGAEYVLAQPPYTMNYQGYLTDSSGTPLNGTYSLAFQLWDAPSGGTMEWGTETYNNTQVTNGIFQVALGSKLALNPDVFDEALFLAVRVEDTWLTTRQPLRAVPYAFGLVPGAEVEGDPTSDYGLTIYNTGAGADDRGLFAQGNRYGVRAHGVNGAGLYASSGNGKYAIRSEDAIYSDGGYAGSDTYVWVPVQNATLRYESLDDAYLNTGFYSFSSPLSIHPVLPIHIDGNLVYVNIPIQVEVPYGRNYLLKQARVYYMVYDNAEILEGYIRGCDFSSGTCYNIGSSYANGASTVFATYDIDATQYYTITASQAPTHLRFHVVLHSASSILYLYGVRLQLDSSY